MKRKQVYISERQEKMIKELADKYGISWAEMLRRIIDERREGK